MYHGWPQRVYHTIQKLGYTPIFTQYLYRFSCNWLFVFVILCLLLEFCLYVLYDMRWKGDSPHQAGVFTRGEGSR
jgi:hypothetical protein